jgi:hypothetical protein
MGAGFKEVAAGGAAPTKVWVFTATLNRWHHKELIDKELCIQRITPFASIRRLY